MNQPRLLTLILTAAGLAGCASESNGYEICIDVDSDAESCPPAVEVDVSEAYLSYQCTDDEEPMSVSGEGEVRRMSGSAQDLACCYEGTIWDWTPGTTCMVGRPFIEGKGAIASAVAPGSGWAVRPFADPLTPAQREAWAQAGVAEHASIAAFARLSLELMAQAAPAALIRGAHLAALDEVAHAERCFELASLPGRPVAPGPFPFAAPLDLTRPLAEIAADAVREGCVGETMGAILARAAADRADDPAIRSILAAIADDEERHAAFSWQVVAWALRVGSDSVKQAVNKAFRSPLPEMDLGELALRSGVSTHELHIALTAGVRSVIAPAARALFAA